MLKIKKLRKRKDFDLIKKLFVSVFKEEPWNDDWSDEKQLDAYIK